MTGKLSPPPRALAIFLVTLGVSLGSLRANQQLGFLRGLTDEWFHLGLALRVTGTLGFEPEHPSLLRPPGYPAFVAAVAYLFAPSPGTVSDAALFQGSLQAVMVAQCVLLALSASLLCLWLSRFFHPAAATAAGLLFGVNPYTVLLTGLLNYSMLHILAVVVASILLQSAFENPPEERWRIGLAGAAWGLAALIRPTTLLVPPLVFLALRLLVRLSWSRALQGALVFVVGMALVISPWTIRNYRASGRLVAVNAQGQTALWGSTVMKFGLDPNHFYWRLLYADHFRPVFARVTGQPEYSYATYVRHNLALEDAFGKEAQRNLRAQPEIYLYNVARSFVAFNAHINSMFLDAFRYLQGGKGPGWPGRAFEAFVGLMTVLSGLGVILGLERRQRWLAAPLVGYLTFCAAHSIVYMDLMYYYVKIPFLFVFAFAFVSSLMERRVRIAGRAVSIGVLFIATLTIFTLTLTLAVL